MSKKKTTEIFKKEVYDLVGDEYTVLEEYKTCHEKILFRHNKCGYEYKAQPITFLSNCRCPKCFGNKRKTINEFKKEIYDLVKDEYTVLSDKYINNKTKVKFKHNKCKKEFEMKPNSFLSLVQRCPFCAGNKKKDTNTFKKEVYDLVGDEYTVLGEYINNNSKIKMKHNKCGYEYNAIPNHFISQNCRCPKCSKKLKKTTEIFKKEVYDLVGDEYTVLGEYINTGSKIKMKHNKCNNIFIMTPNRFLNGGDRCPLCRQSRGELTIKKYLENHNYSFQTQFIIKECKNIKPLPFDFKIDYDDGSFILIEYDGKQHFKQSFNEKEEEFKKQQIRDNIKDEYCKSHNIKLFRIKYIDYNNINDILDSIFQN